MTGLLRFGWSVPADRDVAHAAVDLEGQGGGGGRVGAAGDGVVQPRVEAVALVAVDLHVAGEAELGVDDRVHAGGNLRFDLAGVQVQVDDVAVEGRRVLDLAQVEVDPPVRRAVDVGDRGGAGRCVGHRLATGLPVGGGFDAGARAQTEAGD